MQASGDGSATGGTISIMALSLFSGLLSGTAATAADILGVLNKNLTPVTAALLGTVIVGVFSVIVREGVGLLKWGVERRDGHGRTR